MKPMVSKWCEAIDALMNDSYGMGSTLVNTQLQHGELCIVAALLVIADEVDDVEKTTFEN